MDAVAEVNERLARLGYGEDEARVAPNGSPERVSLRGSLLNSAIAERDDMRRIVAMLPSKAELFAYRVIAGLPLRGG